MGKTLPCKFGAKCTKSGCTFLHVGGKKTDFGPCSYSRKCLRVNCKFNHPDGREIDENLT